MKKFFALLCLFAMLVGLCGFPGAFAETSVPEVTGDAVKDNKFSAAIMIKSQKSFEAAGFQLGDSCDVIFSNGYELKDVPYYNGYYVKNGEPVIVAYPGFKNVRITLNNEGIWKEAELSKGITVTIRLNEAGKYSAVQESLGQSYSFEREDYGSDEEFCNFRAMAGGSLKENFLYRGASPIDNSRGRAAYADQLIEKNGIQFTLDLADSEDNALNYFGAEDFDSYYSVGLYEFNNIAFLSLGSSYQSEAYQQKLAEGLRQMMQSEGPVYIHCTEGKDRTGFVCMLLEALAGASYEEMQKDYMLTYSNYYDVTKEETAEKYDAISELYFDSFAAYLHGTEDAEKLASADYSEDAAAYLRSGGMTDQEITELRNFICQ